MKLFGRTKFLDDDFSRPLWHTNSVSFYLFSSKIWEKVFLEDSCDLCRMHISLNDVFFIVLEIVLGITLLHYVARRLISCHILKVKHDYFPNLFFPFIVIYWTTFDLKNLLFTKFAWFIKKISEIHVPLRKKYFCVVTSKRIRLLTW